jgi:hypothetical protein
MVRTYVEFLELLEKQSGSSDPTASYKAACEEAGNQIFQLLLDEAPDAKLILDHNIAESALLCTEVPLDIVKKCLRICQRVSHEHGVLIPSLFFDEINWEKRMDLTDLLTSTTDEYFVISIRPNEKYDLFNIVQNTSKLVISDVITMTLGELITELMKKRIIYSEEKKNFFAAKKIGLL